MTSAVDCGMLSTRCRHGSVRRAPIPLFGECGRYARNEQFHVMAGVPVAGGSCSTTASKQGGTPSQSRRRPRQQSFLRGGACRCRCLLRLPNQPASDQPLVRFEEVHLSARRWRWSHLLLGGGQRVHERVNAQAPGLIHSHEPDKDDAQRHGHRHHAACPSRACAGPRKCLTSRHQEPLWLASV